MLLFSLSIVFPLLASSVSAVNDVIPHAHGADDTSPVDMYQGTVTLFTPDLGACGENHDASEIVAAVASDVFDAFANGNDAALDNPNLNPVCGQKIFAATGTKRVTATVVDICGECGLYDIALSDAAFSELNSKSHGPLRNIRWTFV